MNLFRAVSATQKILREKKHVPGILRVLIFWMETLGGSLTFIRLQKEKHDFQQVLFQMSIFLWRRP